MVIEMKTQNICKFISEISDDRIYTKNFVYEKFCKKIDVLKDCNIMHLVVTGKGRLVTENVKKELNAGDIFFTFANIPTTIENIDNFKYMYITFDGSRSDGLFSRFGITPLNNVFKGNEKLISFWGNSIAKAGEKNLDLISEAVLLYTFGEMAPSASKEENHLISVVTKYIDDNFTDNELNLQNVSDELGYNSKYISRVFKDNMGLTFSNYLTNIRIQNAVFLIDQGVTAIKNVALLSGYKDPFYFSNVFKTVMGISPKQYIENSKKSSR